MPTPIDVTAVLGSVTPPGRMRRAVDDTPEVVGRIERADAVLYATPVYRGSFTGALKNLLDHVAVAALRDTPVAIVAMGGSDHHYLGVERVVLTRAPTGCPGPGPHPAGRTVLIAAVGSSTRARAARR